MTIHRVLGPQTYKNEGVWKYSEPYIAGLRNLGYTIKTYEIPFHHNSFLRFAYQFLVIPILLMIHKKKSDYIVFYEEYYAILTWLFQKNTYLIIHHLDPLLLENENVSFLGKIFIKTYLASIKQLIHISGIITISHNSKQQIYDYIGNKGCLIHVIPNSFDELIFHKDQRNDVYKKQFLKTNLLSEETKIITHVSVFHPRKNFQTLLHALSLFHQTDTHYLLIKIGNIVDQKEYEQNISLVEKLNVQILHFASMDDEELSKVLNISDLFVFPSEFEGFGRPPILAQACGCPVISTHGGALKEVIGDSAIIFNDIHNSEHLFSLIHNILSDDQLKASIIEKGLTNSSRFMNSANIALFKDLFI